MRLDIDFTKGFNAGFTKKIYERIEAGEKVKCLEEGCDGIIIKFRDRPVTQFSEVDERTIYYYICSKKPKEHKWRYEHDSFRIV